MMMNIVSAEDVCNVLSILWEHFRAEDGALRHAEQQHGIIIPETGVARVTWSILEFYTLLNFSAMANNI